MAKARTDRQKQLLEHLGETGTCSIDELCRLFDVSEMTIRRDLSSLQQEGLLIRTHGGAKLTESAFFEISFAAKTTQFVQEKRQIAERAAEMVSDGDRVIVDSGTTTGHLTRCIRDRRITVVTNALNVASDMIDNKQIDIHVCGGTLQRGSLTLVGPLATRSFESLRCDRLFLGVEGIDQTGTMTVPDIEETLVKQAMMKAAREVIVLADHSKLGRNSFGVIGSLSSVTTLITGRQADEDMLASLRKYTDVVVV